MKKFYYTLLLVTSTFLCCPGMYSQVKMNIVPTSPEAAGLAKAVNYPVNMSTGVPGINIPIYEINSGGLTLPIDLEYHAGGFKVNEQASRAGLGWSLSSELQITRTINGLDDLLGNYRGYMNNNLILADGYKFNGGVQFPNENMYDLAAGKKDGQPDKFYYKLLNKAGAFFILKTGSTYQFIPVPYDNIKIEMTANGLFVITDTDGTVYHFETRENTYNPEQSTTAWKCTKILNNLGKEVITFNYVKKTSKTVRTNTDYIEYYSNYTLPSSFSFGNLLYSNIPPLSYGNIFNPSNNSFYKLSNPKYLQYFADVEKKPILHVPYYNENTNKLVDKEFTYENSTQNPNPFNNTLSIERYMLTEISFRGGKVRFDNNYQLGNIQIYHGNDTIKSIRLYQSITVPYDMSVYNYYNGIENQGTPYLDSLIITAKGQKFEKYSFLYKDKFCFGSHLKIHDAWGYTTLSTQEIVPGYYFSIPGKIYRESHVTNLQSGIIKNYLDFQTSGSFWAQANDEYMMDSGILRRIIYPSGGYVDFDYEPNKYLASMPNYFGDYPGMKNSDLLQYCGGLRIRSINYYDKGENKPTKQKYYKYGEYEEGSGELNVKPELNEYVQTPSLIIGPMIEDYSLDAISKEDWVVHIKKTPLIPPGVETNRSHYSMVMEEKKISLFPTSKLDYTYENGSPVHYTKVTEYNSDLGVVTGKKVYEFYSPRDLDPLWHNKSRVYDYSLITYIKTPGLTGVQKAVSEYKLNGNEYQLLRRKSFEYEKYTHPSKIQVAAAEFKTFYSIIYDGGTSADWSSVSTDVLFYNNNYPLPSGTNMNFGEYTLASYTIPIFKFLIKSETEEHLDSSPSLIKTVTYTYDNKLQPSLVATQNSNGYTIQETYKYPYNFTGVYDNMVTKNMISPVVEERHSTYDEFFYKRTHYGVNTTAGGIVPVSVEVSYNGGTPFTEKTFDKYDQYGNILQVTNKDKIPVSYLWGYGGLYPVAQITGVPYSLLPESYKNDATINSPSSDVALRTVLTSLRNSINSGTVDTYTYKKFVGVTSKTEANGSITFFNYDDLGRLVSIKDNNNKLVESYEYKYTIPDASAFTPTRSNIPVLFTETTQGANPVSYNKILKGGLANSNSDPEQISQQMLDLGMYSYTLPPDPSPQKVKLTLQGFYLPTAPTLSSSDVVIELFRNGQTMYSRKIRFDSIDKTDPDNKEYLFVPPGEYTVVMKTYGGNQYRISNVHFSYFTVEPYSPSIINNLSTINLIAGKEYTLIIAPPLAYGNL